MYGKLPAHGDFIQRDLPPAFVREWDEWLQHFVARTREKMGTQWLDIYLTSPIWRFALSTGVIAEGGWAGIVLPSVDQVGRYFPFTIAVPLPERQNPLEFMSTQTGWYSAIEVLGLGALNSEIALDDLVEELGKIELNIDSVYTPADPLTDPTGMQVELEFEEQSSATAYAQMLDAVLAKTLNYYSIWSTTGSERVTPSVFYTQGLPTPAKLPAMLDGHWQEWGWQQPYALQPAESASETGNPSLDSTET